MRTDVRIGGFDEYMNLVWTTQGKYGSKAHLTDYKICRTLLTVQIVVFCVKRIKIPTVMDKCKKVQCTFRNSKYQRSKAIKKLGQESVEQRQYNANFAHPLISHIYLLYGHEMLFWFISSHVLLMNLRFNFKNDCH